MTIAEGFLAEFENEVRTTRKFLERVPDDRLDWRPHPKSMSVGQLALHMALVPGGIIEAARLDGIPVPDFNRVNPTPANTTEVLDALDASVAKVRAVLPTLTDEKLGEIWRMTQGDRAILEIPRVAVLRNLLLNHWYHHRGQLGVYLRLLGVKVPSTYGPSGDELPEFLN